jgi:feruloyl esterase
MLIRSLYGLVVLAAVAALPGCSGNSTDTPAAAPPRLSCADITTANLNLPNVKVATAKLVTNDTSYPAYCLVQGSVNDRVSAVDGKSYAIGFEMRLPITWNGRFVAQENGGSDGAVVAATGPTPSGAALTSGFAVLSTNAGHDSAAADAAAGSLRGSMFSLDPQARRDYGYSADITMSPIAKNIIQRYYGNAPTYSYMVGCSNGGRHGMVTASRAPELYDGYLVGDPGFNLPKAAVQHALDTQSFIAADPNGSGDMRQAFTRADMNLIGNKILEKCDALDGVADGMVGDLRGCQNAFKLSDLQCTGTKDATCLSASQVTALTKSMSGPKNSQGTQLYTSWSYDPGIADTGWSNWKYTAAFLPNQYPIIVSLGSPSLALTFSTPPILFPNNTATTADLLTFLTNYSFDTDAPKIFATNATFTESAMDFMTMPDPLLKNAQTKGRKMIVYQGQADPVFAADDIISWYENLNVKNNGDATGFARLFTIPGMNHCSGGPALDKFDALSALVNWVEHSQAPDTITAAVSPTNGTVAALVAAKTWSAARTRPLCVWPKIAKYKGSGSIEDAANFTCVAP